MEGFLNRYRNITVLLLVIFAQLLLLALQVKNDQDVRMIRVWTVSAVTPVARLLEGLRSGGVGFIRNYITLHDTNAENRRLQEDNGRLKLENNFLKSELNRADRAKALELFQSHTPSKMLAATIIATGAGSNSKVVFVDRGSGAGVMRGMAVVTPDGIVGKVTSAYPTASQVMLITDADFAAGVISQKGQVRGTLKGDGTPLCRVDYVPLEEKLAPGDWFYTSGDDRIFPQGFPVGVVKAVRPAAQFQEILVEPSGLQHGLVEDVLILLQGVHQEIPDTPPVNQPIYIAPPPPGSSPQAPTVETTTPGVTGTEADKLRAIYKGVGEAQNHTYGEGVPGSKPPDFTKLPALPGGSPAARDPSGAARGSAPGATQGGPSVTPPGGSAAQGPSGAVSGRGSATGATQGGPSVTPPGGSAARGPSGAASGRGSATGATQGGPSGTPPAAGRSAAQPRVAPAASAPGATGTQRPLATNPAPVAEPRRGPSGAQPSGAAPRPLISPLTPDAERKPPPVSEPRRPAVTVPAPGAEPQRSPVTPAGQPPKSQDPAKKQPAPPPPAAKSDAAARRANQAAGAPKGPSH